MTYHFNIHEDETSGYYAECIELPDCATQGHTIEELRANMKDVLDLYLDEPEDSSIVFDPPDSTLKGPHIEAVPVDPFIALKTSLRASRKYSGLTQTDVAKAIGAKSVHTYQRYESGEANPTLKTLIRLKQVLPALDLNAIVESDDREPAGKR